LQTPKPPAHTPDLFLMHNTSLNDLQKAEKHTLAQRFVFGCKVQLHIAIRRMQNLLQPVPRHNRSHKTAELPLIAESRSPLWNSDDNAANFMLTAGKVQNLRIALRYIDGIEVPAGHIFSFWKQTGRVVRRKGYVKGREIREGCMVPVTGGGLCQLSNALYDAALKAGFRIVERHRHSRVVKGSLAEKNRDATVKWNYVDLRFASEHTFYIEALMDSHDLVIRIYGTKGTKGNTEAVQTESPAFLKDCLSCGNTLCSRHEKAGERTLAEVSSLWIGDERWPEFYEYTKINRAENDFGLYPFRRKSRFAIARLCWDNSGKYCGSLAMLSLVRSLHLRYAAWRGHNIPALQLRYDRRMAAYIARHIPAEVRHVIVPQHFLPFLYLSGALAGRSFDVFISREPMQQLHTRLDKLAALHPQSNTAADFRAPQSLAEAETEALNRARRLICAHAAIAARFPEKAIFTGWIQARTEKKSAAPGGKILFPAPALARKGAYEVREWAQTYRHRIYVSGMATESKDFWRDTDIVHTSLSLENTSLLVLPAYVEHQPRILLRALAAGIPVIASVQCGIPQQKGLYLLTEISAAAIEEKYLEIQQTYAAEACSESHTS